MQIKKILAISVVSVASLIVLAVGVLAFTIFWPRRSDAKNSAPPEGEQIVSPAKNLVLISKTVGTSSFLFRKDSPTATLTRLTTAPSGIESEASFSHDGNLVTYAFSASPNGRSTIWIIGEDGTNPHAVTPGDQDALHPAFAPDDKSIVYGSSSFTGHYSPIVGPARHDWDIFSVQLESPSSVRRALPLQITHSAFYDLHSVDVSSDPVKPGGIKTLISTTGYPIGSLFEEFAAGAGARDKIYQPHVAGEPSTGPSYGEAYFLHGGVDILFLAATNTSGGNFDYNVYTMSEVTGGEIKQLTHLKGMTTGLRARPDGRATLVNNGTQYILDIMSGNITTL